jgi:hypothetical protein
MLSHVQTTAPLAFEVGANAHRRVPLSGPVLPRSQLQQRKAALFGLSSGQAARSVAIMAMAPLLAEDAPEQSSGAAGEYAKLQVRGAHSYVVLQLCNEAQKAGPSRHCARQLDEDTEGEVIYVADSFNAESGVLLTDKLRIGKEIAGGAQVSTRA